VQVETRPTANQVRRIFEQGGIPFPPKKTHKTKTARTPKKMSAGGNAPYGWVFPSSRPSSRWGEGVDMKTSV